jgi:hypothetical protein
MLHGHLPILISRLGAVMRHVMHLYHSATRMIELGFYSIQRPSRKFGGRKRLLYRQRRRRKVLPVSRPLLVHYHIFKNAGSSFVWTLRKIFGTDLHTYDSPTSDGVLSPQQIVSYAAINKGAIAISSHQAVLPPPTIPDRNVISSILIRDPIARIRSILRF